jgi:hypothetical protein
MLPQSVRQFLLAFAVLLAIDFRIGASAVTLEELSNTVAYLREGDVFGTGFFVLAEHPFLVTAEHVAQHLAATSFITVRVPGDKPNQLMIGQLVPGVKSLPWMRHSEGDVAVLRLESVKRLGSLEQRFFPVRLLPSQEVAPARELFITVIGFPLALGTVGRFSPITSEARAASGLLRIARFDTGRLATFFILDKPSIGGFSGAPVFLLPQPFFTEGKFSIPGNNNPAICVGLVHGTLSDSTGGKLAAVVPANIIVETVKAAGGKVQ